VVNVAVVGTGNIGGTLARALARAGHRLVFGSRAPAPDTPKPTTGEPGADIPVTAVGDAIAGAEVVIVAIPGGAVGEFAREHGAALAGRLVLDAANRIGGPPGTPAHSAAVYAERAPEARYARVFNSVGWEVLADPTIDGTRADMFFSCAAADRAVVEELVDAVGLRPVYVGDGQHDVVDGVLRLWIALAMGRKRGRRLAFRMLTPATP
jgi:predicted dinucleotide-binding enzyme